MSENIKKLGTYIGIGGGIICSLGLIPIALGFTSTGIAAGSIAAGIHSLIGNAASGSLFSILTSLGMKGAFNYTVLSGSFLGLGGLGTYVFGKEKKNENSKESKINHLKNISNKYLCKLMKK